MNATRPPKLSPPMPEIPPRLRLLPFADGVLFPYMLVSVVMSAEHLKKVIEEAVSHDNLVGVFTVKSEGEAEHSSGFYNIGAAAIILQMLRLPNGSLQVLLQGLRRIAVTNIVEATIAFGRKTGGNSFINISLSMDFIGNSENSGKFKPKSLFPIKSNE